MKYLVLVLVTAAFAGLEFHHGLAYDDAHGGAVCMSPETQQAMVRDMLLQHSRSH